MSVKFYFDNCSYDWQCQHFFGRPTGLETFLQYTITDTGIFAPFFKSSALTIEFNKTISSSIICLFFAAGPKTIIWIITFFIVFSFKCMFGRRSVAHVRIPIFKYMPFMTNRYPSPAVIFKGWLLWILATLNHILPNFINFCSRHFVSEIHSENIY